METGLIQGITITYNLKCNLKRRCQSSFWKRVRFTGNEQDNFINGLTGNDTTKRAEERILLVLRMSYLPFEN